MLKRLCPLTAGDQSLARGASRVTPWLWQRKRNIELNLPLAVPLWLASKLALYLAMRDQRITNSELARRRGLHEHVIRRMLNPRHATKAEKIQTALALLGKQLTVEVLVLALTSPPAPRCVISGLRIPNWRAASGCTNA